MRLLRYPAFLAVCLSHLSVDLLNGQVGVLLAALSVTLALTNEDIGRIAMIYAMLGSLSQPLFGWLADKDGGRGAMFALTAGGGVVWMAIFYALFAVLPGEWALVALVIAALGSGAFHPPGAAKAVQVGAIGLAGQAATAASIFFLFGQIGLSAGPRLSGDIFERFGRIGVLGLAAFVLPIGLYSLWALRGAENLRDAVSLRGATGVTRVSAAGARTEATASLWFLALVLIISGLRVWAQTNITTFAPKYFHDLGLTPSLYGSIVMVFMAGTSIGGVIGSVFADRWNYTATVIGSITLSIAPLFVFPLVSGIWIFVVAFVAGLFNGGPHSILVTMAQRTMPSRAGFASGLILGTQFAIAAIGAYFTGVLADSTGLAFALQTNAALSLVAAALSVGLFLKNRVPNAEALAPGD
ncbi:MAG: MFS transporter [Anaerolineales bacterium]